MFASELYEYLVGDPVLRALVGTYLEQPNIFNTNVPESVDFPYLVFRFYQVNPDSIAVDRFSLTFKYHDYGESSENAVKVWERLIYLLDGYRMDSTVYGCIRFYRTGGGPVEENDPRAINYYVDFDIRCGRKNINF